MNKLLFSITFTIISFTAHAQYLVNVNAKGVMLDGYDVVELLNKKEIPGSYKFTTNYAGAVYHFSTDANKKKFEMAPEKYAPQYGGHCAVSTSMGKLEPGNIETWSVVGGKLYVQRNAKAKGMWDKKGPQMFIPKADKNWPELTNKYASGLTTVDLLDGRLTFEAAQKIGKKALRYLRDNKAPGGAIAIVDEAGMPIYLIRETGTFRSSSEVSIGKARSAALFGFPTKNLEDGIYGGRNSLITAGYNMMRGGYPIMVNGKVVGGIGVSGAASADQDVEIAEAGVGLR